MTHFFRQIPQGFPRLLCCALLAAALSPGMARGEGPPPGKVVQFRLESTPRTLGAAASELAGLSQTQIEVPQDLTSKRLEALPQGELKFWEALQQLTHAGDTDWSWWEDRKIVVESHKPQRAVSGWGVNESILIRAQGKLRPGAQGKHLLRINLTVDVEPARWPLFGEVRDGDVTVSLGSAKLPAYSPTAARTLRFTGQQADAALDYVWDEATQERQVRITGALSLRVAAGREVIRLPVSGGPGGSRQVGETVVAIQGSHATADAMHVELSVKNPRALAWESHQQALLHREAWLEGIDGRKLKFDEMEAEPSGPTAQRVRFRFPLPPGNVRDWRLVYIAAVETRDVTVPFTIEKAPVIASESGEQ